MLGRRGGSVADREVGIMKGMLQFSGALKREPAIDIWLKKQAPELGAIAQSAMERRAEAAQWRAAASWRT